MAGKDPPEALTRFVRPIQRALSCVTPAQLVYRPPLVDEVQTLAVSDDPIRVPSTGSPAEALFLSVQQQYVIRKITVDEPRELGPWKVSTRAYRYRLDRPEGTEVASWHWHPQGKIKFPHLHVKAEQFAELHLPTSRVPLESVIRLLLAELDARPRRPDDWEDVLDDVEERLRRYWTWA